VTRPTSNLALWLPLLPDAMTCAFFLVVWADPMVFGPLSVRTAMLTMLLEFFLVHATGFFTVFANDRQGSKWKRIGAMAGLSSFYVLMIAAYSMSYHEWWPLFAFGWLLAGKVAWVWKGKADPDDVDGGKATFRGMAAWAGSVALFLFGVVVTCIADIPRWGMTAALQPQFGLDMTSDGLWESEPHRVVAFGALYFGATFVAKAFVALWGLVRPRRAG
jgi:hypothetical protein